MNDAINFGNFTDLLIKSGEEHEPYGMGQYGVPPFSATTTVGDRPAIPIPDSAEYETWYGE